MVGQRSGNGEGQCHFEQSKGETILCEVISILLPPKPFLCQKTFCLSQLGMGHVGALVDPSPLALIMFTIRGKFHCVSFQALCMPVTLLTDLCFIQELKKRSWRHEWEDSICCGRVEGGHEHQCVIV